MSYFAAALLFLLAGETAMMLGFGYPSALITAPETLFLVHIVAIGWLGLLMTGALLQFVPVLVARPLQCAWMAGPALLLLLVGLSCLSAGFLGLAGFWNAPAHALPAGGAVAALGFAVVVVMIGSTLRPASPLPLPARFVAVGLFCLCGTILLGMTFALALSGVLAGDLATNLLLRAVPLHAALGLGGWLTFTAMGVSYRLLTMFLLAPERARATTRIVWWAGSSALMLVAACVFLVVPAAGMLDDALYAAALLSVVAVALYAADILRIYRERKRKAIELNSRASLAAFAALFMTVVLSVLLAATGNIEHAAGPLTYLFVFGWLTGLGLAQLYKITPFLTWLECYGPVLGRVPTPRVQDLVRESRAAGWFYLYYGAVIVGTLGLLIEENNLFMLAAASQLIATVGLIGEFIRTRRLADIDPAQRASAGIRPNLFLPTLVSRRPS
jgi:hypothetical protein